MHEKKAVLANISQKLYTCGLTNKYNKKMKLIVKVLNGEECTIEVEESSTILDVKVEVEKRMKIPLPHQKLLNVGRTLADDKTVNSYSNIKDGTKLILVIKKPDPLRDVIFRSFKKYYNEQQSEKLTAEFMTDFEKKMKQLSLDDIEHLATGLLASQSEVE